jgi:hypothetical protein
MSQSSELFGRFCQVTVGPPGKEGRVWSGLRTRFRVYKNGDSTPNKAEIAIYNLSADSRHYIEKAAKAKDAIILEAGYKAEHGLLFTGRLELGDSETRGRHNHHHQGSDWVTTCEGRDGAREYRAIVISKSFGPKVSDETVIHELAKAMGVTVGTIKGLTKVQFNHGRALSGAVSSELNAMCAKQGVRWSIQDGVIQVLPYATALDSTATVISPATGMVGSPQRTERGIKLLSLLRPGLNPGKLLDVQAADLKGRFVLEKIEHYGDTHENDWYSEIEAIPVP